MKTAAVSVLVLMLSVSQPTYLTTHGGDASSAGQNDVMCHMPNMSQGHDHKAMMAANSAVTVLQDDSGQEQNPAPGPGQGGQPGDTRTHRFSPGDGCSSMDPNAPSDKELNGVKPNTVGCMCVRKCVNGQTVEDLSKDEKGVYICKNASHKDRCSCPDPCKS